MLWIGLAFVIGVAVGVGGVLAISYTASWDDRSEIEPTF